MRSCSHLILLLIMILSFSSPALADSIKVTMSAAEIYYDYESKQVEATGTVKITYKDIKIEADRALINQDQDILLATGNVHVVKNDDEMNGDRFLYYLQLQRGIMSPIDMEVTDEEIEGPVDFRAGRAEIDGETIDFKQGYLSSCELPHPHYHFTAKEIEYLPGDKIVLRRVWYWEQGFRLFYLPVLFISLEEGKENKLGFQFGWNEADGAWVSFWYSYYLNDSNYGDIYSDKISQWGGDGIGVRHWQDLSKTHRWYQDYYYFDKSDLGLPEDELKFGLGYENWSNPKLKLNTYFENWHRFTEYGDPFLENRFNLNLNGQSPYPRFQIDFDEEYQNTRRHLNLGWGWDYYFDQSFRMNINGSWDLTEVLSEGKPNIQHNYSGSLAKDWGWSNASLLLSDRKTNSTYSDNVIPDFKYTIPKWTWPLLGDMKVATQYTHLQKLTKDSITGKERSSEGDRWAWDVEKLPVNLWQTEKITINNKNYFKYRDFFVDESESEIMAFASDIGLTSKFTEALSTEVRLGATRVEGIPSTYFNYADNILPGAFIRNYWYWRSTAWNSTLSTGYIFEREYAEPVIFSLNWTPNPENVFNFNTIYDWELGPGQTDLNITSRPRKDWELNMGIGHNFQHPEQPWTRKEFRARIIERFNEKLRAELTASYDLYTDSLGVANATLVYTWHCRDISFYYDWVEQEWWIQLSIKAFPQAKLRTFSDPIELWELYNE